jgi:hypothetical protein
MTASISSKRRLGSAVVFKRWACEQTEPGDADPHPIARAVLLVLSDTDFATIPAALQVRRFMASEGTPRYITIGEFASQGSAPPAPPESLVGWYRAYEP